MGAAARGASLSRGAKVIALSSVGMLLGYGLCASVPGEDYDWRVWTGLWVVVGSFVVFLIGCAMVGQARRLRREDRERQARR